MNQNGQHIDTLIAVALLGLALGFLVVRGCEMIIRGGG